MMTTMRKNNLAIWVYIPPLARHARGPLEGLLVQVSGGILGQVLG